FEKQQPVRLPPIIAPVIYDLRHSPAGQATFFAASLADFRRQALMTQALMTNLRDIITGRLTARDHQAMLRVRWSISSGNNGIRPPSIEKLQQNVDLSL
ncbi:unnamed protein product, partial [marine sediment metagenome]